MRQYDKKLKKISTVGYLLELGFSGDGLFPGSCRIGGLFAGERELTVDGWPDGNSSVRWNRNAWRDARVAMNLTRTKKRFDSLRTGKRLQRASQHQHRRQSVRFQFPSNGKASPKPVRWMPVIWFYSGFDSLRTGKRLQSLRHSNSNTTTWVSIPFKRESVSKGADYRESDLRFEKVSIPFKREGVSKAKISRGESFSNLENVSIPFKRESVSKDMDDVTAPVLNKFRFPSNGKAYPNHSQSTKTTKTHILFPFPSNGKAYPKVEG